MDARTDTVAVVAVLTAARAIVADPTRWCAWPHALDADGLKREGREKRAVRWGALGALDRVAAESDAAQDSIVKATSLLNRAACEIPGTDPATLQVLDLNPSHIVTLELFDRAIRAAPKPETPGTVHILTIARTLIVHPDRWAQGAIALDRCPQPAGASRRRTRWRRPLPRPDGEGFLRPRQAQHAPQVPEVRLHVLDPADEGERIVVDAPHPEQPIGVAVGEKVGLRPGMVDQPAEMPEPDPPRPVFPIRIVPEELARLPAPARTEIVQQVADSSANSRMDPQAARPSRHSGNRGSVFPKVPR